MKSSRVELQHRPAARASALSVFSRDIDRPAHDTSASAGIRDGEQRPLCRATSCRIAALQPTTAQRRRHAATEPPLCHTWTTQRPYSQTQRPQVHETPFAGRIGLQDSVSTDEDTLKEQPDAAPLMTLSAAPSPQGFLDATIWRMAIVEG